MHRQMQGVVGVGKQACLNLVQPCRLTATPELCSHVYLCCTLWAEHDGCALFFLQWSQPGYCSSSISPAHVSKQPLSTQVGARWLSEWCHTAGANQSAAGSSDDAFALAVSRVLLASKSADEAAAELFDLLGDGSFDAIQQLLEHR